MNDNETPISIEEIKEPIYGGFGARAVALLIDFLICAPVILLTHYINSFDRNFYFVTIIPFWAFMIFYFLYPPVKYGGTPGKLVVKLKIKKSNGDPIQLKQGISRMIVTFGLSLVGASLFAGNILKADPEVFKQLSWTKQQAYLNLSSNSWYIVFNNINSLWVIANALSLLIDKKKRALHDFIAGTVVINEEDNTNI